MTAIWSVRVLKFHSAEAGTYATSMRSSHAGCSSTKRACILSKRSKVSPSTSESTTASRSMSLLSLSKSPVTRAVHIQADQRIVRVPLNLVGQATQQRFDLVILCNRHGPSVVDSPPLLLYPLPEVIARREDRLFAGPPPPTRLSCSNSLSQ